MSRTMAVLADLIGSALILIAAICVAAVLFYSVVFLVNSARALMGALS